jgi:hypothetical protein
MTAPRKEILISRLDQLGTALLADIAASLGVPMPLARRWAGEWRLEQARQLGQGGEIGAGDGDDATWRRTIAGVLHASGVIDAERPAVDPVPAERGAGIGREADPREQGDRPEIIVGRHRATMRMRACFRNRGKI